MTIFATGSPRIRQVAGSGDGKRARDGNDTATLKFMVGGPTSGLAAETALFASGQVPALYDGMRLDTYKWSEQAADAYLFSLQYNRRRLDVDEYRLAVDTSGGSIKMTTSLETTSYAPTGKTAPDFASSIDVSDGKPQGVDRVIPTLRYDLTYRMTRPANILAFTELASELTGTTNSAPILGRAAGELLLLGASGDFGNNADPEFKFSWAASKNATLSIGDIADIEKAGHEYLWILYEETKSGTGADEYVVTDPRAAYVERIYEAKDHNLLGLVL